MILRRLSTMPVRALAVALFAVTLVGIAWVAGRPAGPADAGIYGQVNPNPTTGFIILGHRVGIPVVFTTCTTTSLDACHLGAYEVTTTYNTANFSLETDGFVTEGFTTEGTVTDGGLNTAVLSSVSGTSTGGIGVTGYIADTGVPNVAYTGAVTSGSTSTTLVSSGATWTVNEWAGKKVAITGSATAQTRTIVSNTATVLTVSSNWSPIPSVGNIFAIAGDTPSSSTTVLHSPNEAWTPGQWVGSQLTITDGTGENLASSRNITANTANTITVSPAFATTPDGTSAYYVGLMSTGGSGPSTLVNTTRSWASNEWQNSTVYISGGHGAGQSRTVTSNSATSLTISSSWSTTPDATSSFQIRPAKLNDTTKSWSSNQWAGSWVTITSGAGAGQSRAITSNNATSLTVNPAWDEPPALVPDGTSQYYIGQAILTDTNKNWTPSQWVGHQVSITGGAGAGQSRTIVGNTATGLTVSPGWGPTPATAPDATSQYLIALRSTGGNTSTTLVDNTRAWTTNQWAGNQVILTTGPAAGQSRRIVSNTDTTLTVTPAWSGPQPDNTTVFYIATVSTGANGATTFNNNTRTWTPNQWVGAAINITGGTGVGQVARVVSNTATQLVVSPFWNITPTSDSRYTIAMQSTGVNTTTTLVDTNKAWKANQWVNTEVTLTGGLGAGQTRKVITNTLTTLTVSPAWTTTPNSTTTYKLGGMTDGGWLGSTGRPLSCFESTYGTGLAEKHCSSIGSEPAGPIGAGNLVHLTLRAHTKGLSTIGLTNTNVLTITGYDIPADNVNATRRIIICPDSNPNNVINALDLNQTAQSFGQPPSIPAKDPSEDGTVSSIDLLMTAGVFGKKCDQS